MKQNTLRKSYFLFAGLLLGLIWLPGLSWKMASAQDGPAIAFLPENLVINLDEGNTAEAQIYVSNVTEMNAFDIELIYDSSVVILTDYTFVNVDGSDESEFNPDLCYFEINEPGFMKFVCMKFYENNFFTGSGVLVYLTFEALGEGSTTIEFTKTDLSALGGVVIHADIHHGFISACYPTYSLAGTVRMQGRAVQSGVPVTLTNVEHGAFPAITADAVSNNLAVTDLQKGTYTFTTHQPRYLNVHAGLNKTFTISDDTALPPLELKGGNAHWDDNVIDVLDASLVGLYYGQPISEASADADVNFDGKINIYDLVLVAGNFGLTAEDAYAEWMSGEW